MSTAYDLSKPSVLCVERNGPATKIFQNDDATALVTGNAGTTALDRLIVGAPPTEAPGFPGSTTRRFEVFENAS